jgi:hypothetical protein
LKKLLASYRYTSLGATGAADAGAGAAAQAGAGAGPERGAGKAGGGPGEPYPLVTASHPPKVISANSGLPRSLKMNVS